MSRVKDVPTSRETIGEPTERGDVHPACDERRLRQLLSVGPAVTFAFRLEGQQPTTFISENVVAVTGWPADRFYADPSFWTRHLHPDDADRVLAGHRRLAVTSSVTSEYRFKCGDGVYRWMYEETHLLRDESGDAVEGIGFWVDATVRREAQQAQRESEERYRSLVSNLPVGVYRTTPDGEIVECNEAAAQILGFADADSLKRVNVRTVYAEPGERERHLAKLRSRSSQTEELCLRHQDGHLILVRDYTRPVRDEHGRIASFDGILIDVTALRRAEQALQKSNTSLERRVERRTAALARSNAALHAEREALSQLLVEAPYGVILTDARGKFLFVNRRFTEITGYELADVPSVRDWYRLAFPDPADRRRVIAARKAERKRRQSEQPVLRFRCKDGQLRDLRSSGTFLEDKRAITMLADVTEERRAHEALRESEERFRRLVELSPDGICVIRNGLIAFANTRLAAILGRRDPQELLGSPANDLLPTVADAPRSESRGEAEPSTSAALTEAQLRRPDGSLVAAEITAAPVPFDDANGLQVVVRDVSDRKRLEAQLQHAQKMELVGRLAAGVAHDFNNLLQGLLSTLELFRLRAGSAGTTAGLNFDEIAAQVKRGGALARQLLMFSRPEAATPVDLDLAALVADNATFLTRLLPANVVFEVQAVPGTVPVFGDPGQLEQVLVNLVVNAQDAMPDGGTITVGCGVQASGWPYFSVTDTGVGIAPALLDHIFEPFFTTKPRGKGTGLGLAVVKGIVDRHQGWLQVDSQPGHGTTMTVILPSRDAAAHSSTKPPDPRPRE